MLTMEHVCVECDSFMETFAYQNLANFYAPASYISGAPPYHESAWNHNDLAQAHGLHDVYGHRDYVPTSAQDVDTYGQYAALQYTPSTFQNTATQALAATHSSYSEDPLGLSNSRGRGSVYQTSASDVRHLNEDCFASGRHHHSAVARSSQSDNVLEQPRYDFENDAEELSRDKILPESGADDEYQGCGESGDDAEETDDEEFDGQGDALKADKSGFDADKQAQTRQNRSIHARQQFINQAALAD